MRVAFATAAIAALALFGVQVSAVDANSLDHFSFATITTPQTSTVPFVVTILAQDATNALVTGFAGPVALSAAGSNGLTSLTPTNSGTFSGGLWTGNLTINVIDSNIVLQASDSSGHTGSSNPFDTTSTHVLIINLPASDIGYDPFSDKIYASVISGNLSNTVTVITPETGAIGPSVQVGPGLGRIAVADNGQVLHVAVNGLNAVKQVMIPSLTPGLSFSTYSGLPLTDMVAVPGSADSVAVAVYRASDYGRVDTIYDNGVARANSANAANVIRFGGTNTVLYGVNNIFDQIHFDFYTLTVDASGLTVSNYAPNVVGGFYGVYIEYGGGLLFTSYGQEIDPVTSTVIGGFPANGPVWPDTKDGRVLILYGSTLEAYDLTTSALIGSQAVYGMSGSPGYLNWAGANRIAFETSAGEVFIVDTGLVPSGGPADLALIESDFPNPVDIGSNLTHSITVTNLGPNTATNVLALETLPANIILVSATASQGSCTQVAGVVTCSLGSISNGTAATAYIVVQATRAGPVQTVTVVTSDTTDSTLTNNVVTNVTTVGFIPAPDSVNVLNLTTSDLIYDTHSGRLYVSIPDGVTGGISDSVAAIDPMTGLVGQQVFVGEGPGKLAAADNGQYLYVGLTGTNLVARLDLPSMTTGLVFSLGTNQSAGARYVDDMLVLPGSPGSVAITLTNSCCSPAYDGVVVFDDGIPRPTMIPPGIGPDTLTLSGSDAVLYGHDNESSLHGFYTMNVRNTGMTVTSDVPDLPNASCGISFDSGLIFTSTGAVIQPTNSTQTAAFPASGLVCPDLADGRVFFLNGSTLLAFDPYTQLEIGSVAVSGISGSTADLVRWGADGLAFTTSGGQVFVLRTSLIPSGSVADLSVQALVSPTPGEMGIAMTNSLTVTNSGPSDAANVVMLDKLPAGISFNSAVSSQGSCMLSNGLVVGNLGTVSAGASASLTIVFTPSIGTMPTNMLTSSILVMSAASEPNFANNSTSLVMTVVLDSVGDGIPDWWRLQYFGSANTTNTNTCASCDFDGDGFSNLQEYLAGTDPGNSNSYPVDWPALVVSNVLSGLSNPTLVTHAGDGSGRLFICERIGRVRVANHGVLSPTAFLDIRTRVNTFDIEQGLLGLAFPPGFTVTNSHLYVSYTDSSNDLVVSRFFVTTNSNVVNATTEQRILTVPKPYTNHNGGQLAFGPDGFLYVGIGDGGSEGDPLNNAQTTTNLLGKILRIDTEGTNQLYGIPPTNPFVGNPAYLPEIWAYGLRNPWRFSFDRLTGDLYIGDVGENSYEEIDFQSAGDPGGENYGWRWFEGDYPYNLPVGANTNNLTWPVTEYTHVNGNCAVIGGYVYRGSAYPRMHGIYFFGDYCSGAIWGLTEHSGMWITTQLYSLNDQISSFGEDDAGNLYVARFYSGEISQIQDTGAAYMPVIAPSGGTYPSNLIATVSCNEPGAIIHYTTNGVDPTQADPTVQSGGSIPINSTLLLKARAFKAGVNPSPVVSANYVLAVTAPTFSPPAGTITRGTTITITTVTPGATILYTLDGTDPTSSSPVYTPPLVVNGTVTLKAKGVENGFSDSSITSVSYSLPSSATPQFSPSQGPITNGTQVTITSGTYGVIIHYTLDGTSPTSSSPVYTGPLLLSGNVTLLAMTTSPDYQDSPIQSAFFGLIQYENTLVSTLAGSGQAGFSNGPGISAQFYFPAGICNDGSGNLYVADSDNNRIRKVSPSGFVTTFAGTGVAGNQNGPGATAQFNRPIGTCVDAAGNVYVADANNLVVRKINTAGTVSTVAGTGAWGYLDGPALTAQFSNLGLMAIDGAGTLYISEVARIREMSTNAIVSTLAGTGTDSPEGWSQNVGISVDGSGNVFAAIGYGTILEVSPSGVVQLYAGKPFAGINTQAYADGPRLSAQFLGPASTAVDKLGNVYIADGGYIRKINPSGIVTTLAGNGQSGSMDGPGWQAEFNGPYGICVDAGGNIYVADENNQKIRKIVQLDWDGDNDGIPDAWTQRYFGHPYGQTNDLSCAACDADGDGMNNLQEFLAGTDPTNGSSAFRIISITNTGTDILVTWTMGNGKTNDLQVTAGDGSGSFSTNYVDLFIVTNTVGTVTNYLELGGATNGPSRFYRVRLVP